MSVLPVLPDGAVDRTAELDSLFQGVQSGDPDAAVKVAAMYSSGRGVDRIYGIALALYKTAAAEGMAEACYNVAVYYEVGLGTAPDPFVAQIYFEKAGEFGLHQGLYEASQYYLTGKTGPVNEKKALDLLQKAAEAGNGIAANDLGMIHARGLLGQEQDERKAVDYFIRGADLGNPESMKNIGVAFRDGLGRTPDVVKALKWFVIASRLGYPVDSDIEVLQAEMEEEQRRNALDEAERWIAEFESTISDSAEERP